jgi:hypothetical protein
MTKLSIDWVAGATGVKSFSVAQRLEAVRIERHREVGREQHHGAVRLGVLDVFDRDAGAGAGLVLHQNGRGIACAAQAFGKHARAVTSVPPPAGNPTIMCTGFLIACA